MSAKTGELQDILRQKNFKKIKLKLFIIKEHVKSAPHIHVCLVLLHSSSRSLPNHQNVMGLPTYVTPSQAALSAQHFILIVLNSQSQSKLQKRLYYILQ